MKKAGNKGRILKISISTVLFATALFCVLQRIPQCFSSQNPAVLAAAAFTLADGEYRLSNTVNDNMNTQTSTHPTAVSEENTDPLTVENNKNRDKSGYYDSFADHTGEAKYEIAENSYFGGGTAVDSCFVKNKTGVDYDFESMLEKPLTFKTEKNSKEPQVLIYHTHTTEGYIDEDVDYFYESYYSRTDDSNFNVVAVGSAIAQELNARGINTYHDTTIHDATYDGSYDRSAETVTKDMEKYKDVKVVLDIHRDAIGTEERKIKPVFTYNGKKAAQIMILSGCDDGSGWFPNWENNLSFALKLQNTAEKLYPGMTRPLSFDYFRYNEYICDGSLLIEVGTEANSIDEVEYTGKLLADVIAQVLES